MSRCENVLNKSSTIVHAAEEFLNISSIRSTVMWFQNNSFLLLHDVLPEDPLAIPLVLDPAGVRPEVAVDPAPGRGQRSRVASAQQLRCPMKGLEQARNSSEMY